MRTLETDRLRLRPPTADDAPFILSLLNEPGFLESIGDRNVRTLEQAEAYIAAAPLFDVSAGLGFNVVEVRETGEALGLCGLVKREVLDAPDVGYAVLARAWGQGYAQEAAAATLAHARDDLGFQRVVAITGPENAGSRRVLEQIGMRLEAVLRLPGYAGDSCLYATA